MILKECDESILNSSLSLLHDTIIQKNSSNRSNAILLYSWIGKALILLYHEKGYSIAFDLISLFNQSDISSHCVSALEGMMKQDELGYLTKSSHCQVKFLYKQRFFNECLPKLVNGFHSFKDTTDIQKNFLICLFYLIKHIPKQILVNEAKSVIQSIDKFI